MSDPLTFSWQSTPASWACYYDPEGPVGFGKTKEAALRELIEDIDGDEFQETMLAGAVVAAVANLERELAEADRRIGEAEQARNAANDRAADTKRENAALREALGAVKFEAMAYRPCEAHSLRIWDIADKALDSPHTVGPNSENAGSKES